MTQPDVRVAFREGGFNARAAFYPRAGCGEPPPAFSILAAGGFSVADAIAATMRGELPSEDPATCMEATPDATVVAIPLRPTAEVRETGCAQRRLDGGVRYRQPTEEPLDLTARTFACAAIPDLGSGEGAGIIQLVVSSRTDESCRGLSHYTLRGCEQDGLACELPAWDLTATPPSWWPCPAQAPRDVE